MSKHIPERTCVACRKKGEKKEFLKIVKSGETAVIDESGRLDGRGAYICKDADCIKKAIKTKAFNRSFKCNVDNDLYQSLENYLKNL